jgi:hypothetical protein
MKSAAVKTFSRIKRREKSSRRIRRMRIEGKDPLFVMVLPP